MIAPRHQELARFIYDSHLKRCGRRPPLLPLHNPSGKRSRVPALDVAMRLRERKVVWSYDDTLGALVELERRGVLFRGEGGFAVISLDALGVAAGLGTPSARRSP